MKRTTVLLLMLAVAVLHINAQASGVKGDANNDGTVTITDAVAVVDIILNGK